jgi:outer membrane lipoprotein-sorting protein
LFLHVFLLLILAFFSFSPGVPAKDASLNAEAVMKRLAAANPGLKDYTSDVSVALKVRYSLLATTLNLKGAHYFKAPDKSRIEIKNKPPFLSQYPDVFDFHLKNWNDFKVALRPETPQDGAYYILELTPKKAMGDLEKRTLWVNKADFTTPVEELFYKKGSSIKVRSTYKKIQGYQLYNFCKAEVNFPSISLSGTVEMLHENHKINQGLSDELFKKK